MAEIITCQLDKYEINLFSVTDTLDVALAKHEYVNTDGAYIQNMGNHPKEITFTCYFYGSQPDVGDLRRASYKNHFDFLNAMSNSTESTTAGDGNTHIFTHPQYGTINVSVQSLTIFNDDTQQFATIDISLIERDILKTQYDVKDSFLTIDGLQVKSINADLVLTANQLQSGGSSTLIGKIIDPAQKLASQFTTVTQATRTFLNECDRNLTALDSFYADIIAPVTAVEQACNFVSDVPGRILGSINSSCNRIVTAFANITNLPVQFTNNCILQFDNLMGTLTGTNVTFFQSHFMTIASGALLSASSKLIQSDAERKAYEKSREQKLTFDPAGNRINVAVFNPVMTTGELDFLLSSVRAYVQRALVMNRDNQGLKDMAASILNISDEGRRTVKSMTVNSIPMHMLCVQLGLPYNAADRMLSLNPHVKNPNFCSGVMQVYAK